MTADSVKHSVIKTYGQLAKNTKKGVFSNFFSCCNPRSVATEIGEKIGYSNEDLNSVPEDANLGVGCGNPSSFANIKKGDTVVDLGSGAGFDAFIVSQQVGETGKVIGIDLSDDMLKLAQKNAEQGNYKNIIFKKGDIEALPLENEIADTVISNCVINLSLKKEVVFQEAFRVLKSGGKLAISDIVLKKELPSFITNLLAGHIACVSGATKLETYINYIKAAGFKEIMIESQKNFPLELMLSDPQLMKIAKTLNYDVNSEETKEIASRVLSVSLTAKKI